MGDNGKVRRVSTELDKFLVDWHQWSANQMNLRLGVYQSQDVLAKIAREKLMNQVQQQNPVGPSIVQPGVQPGIKVVRLVTPKRRRGASVFEFRV